MLTVPVIKSSHFYYAVQGAEADLIYWFLAPSTSGIKDRASCGSGRELSEVSTEPGVTPAVYELPRWHINSINSLRLWRFVAGANKRLSGISSIVHVWMMAGVQHRCKSEMFRLNSDHRSCRERRSHTSDVYPRGALYMQKLMLEITILKNTPTYWVSFITEHQVIDIAWTVS